MGRCPAPAVDGFLVFEARLAEMDVNVNESRGHNAAAAVDNLKIHGGVRRKNPVAAIWGSMAAIVPSLTRMSMIPS